jgi:hypothetical protein
MKTGRVAENLAKYGNSVMAQRVPVEGSIYSPQDGETYHSGGKPHAQLGIHDTALENPATNHTVDASN